MDLYGAHPSDYPGQDAFDPRILTVTGATPRPNPEDRGGCPRTGGESPSVGTMFFYQTIPGHVLLSNGFG